MPDETSDAHGVIQRLQLHLDRVTKMLDAIADRRSIGPAEKADLQRQLADLKRDLEADSKRGASVHGQATATAIERAYLFPAVHKASADLRIKVNSHPCKSAWHSELTCAAMDLRQFLDQLRRAFPQAAAESSVTD